MLKEELHKKEALIKELIKTIRNLTTSSLKQQPIHSQSFTSDPDEYHHISTARPANYKEINLRNTNMSTSTINNDLREKRRYYSQKKQR